jgi:outer membrane lipase/esterase
MKMKTRILPALLLSLFAGAMAPEAAAQQQFTRVVVFGDSLSDAGYYRPFLASLGLPASVVATLGRFTTNPGPVFSEILTTYYTGATPAPSNVTGGLIFAQGGARVALASPLTPPGQAQRPVSTQVGEYLGANGGAADPNALYSVFAGANDIFVNLGAFSAGGITQAQLQTNVLAAATAEVQQIARLRAAGARYIIVSGLPDIGGTPQFAAADAATRGAVTQLSAGYNTTLFSGLASAGIRVIPIDSFTFFTELRNNAAAFGITNTTGLACGPFPPITTATTISSQFCGPTNLVAANAATTYLFADGVHPTTVVQGLFAQFVEGMIDGPIAYSTLAEVPMRTRAGQLRTLSDAFSSRKAGDTGLSVFVSGDRGNFDVDSGTPGIGVDSRNTSATLGVTARLSESALLGVAVGTTHGDGSFGGGRGGFTSKETVFSLFGTAKWRGLYGSAVVSVSDIDFDNMHRDIVLGSVTRTASASTGGSNASAYFAAGYDFSFGRLSIGPTVSVSTQSITINSFDETGAASSNLRIGEQKKRSEVWSAGVRASANLGGWTPWLRITADKERRDDPRFINAMPLTMVATGGTYDLPAYSPDRDFVTGAVGINGTMMERVGLSLAYYKVSGRSGIKEDGISALLSYRF